MRCVWQISQSPWLIFANSGTKCAGIQCHHQRLTINLGINQECICYATDMGGRRTVSLSIGSVPIALLATSFMLYICRIDNVRTCFVCAFIQRIGCGTDETVASTQAGNTTWNGFMNLPKLGRANPATE